MPDVAKAIIAFAVLVLIMALIGSHARADRPVNGWFPTGAVAFIGVDEDFDLVGGDSGVPFCREQHHQTGVFGARLPLYRFGGRHTVVANLEHNSCLQEENDAASDNRIGIRYEYRAW